MSDKGEGESGMEMRGVEKRERAESEGGGVGGGRFIGAERNRESTRTMFKFSG